MHGNLTERLYQISKAEIYRYSEEPFTLASGQQSHHYFNCKKITLFPDRLALMADAIIDDVIAVNKISCDGVGGLTLGADPIAYAVSLAFHRRGETVFPLVVRKEAKGHGTRRQIEGEVDRVSTVLVVDDVITTAGSTLKAVHALREAGLTVQKVVCIVDRQEGGEEALRAEGIELHPLFRKSDFIS